MFAACLTHAVCAEGILTGFGLDLRIHGVCVAWISKSRYNADLEAGLLLVTSIMGGQDRVKKVDRFDRLLKTYDA